MTQNLSAKGQAEIAYWGMRLRQQGQLSNDHFEFFYTTYFGLEKDFYRGRTVLDIGCGPRGSLEWADQAALRVGLDPLAGVYRQIGTEGHRMSYLAGRAEQMPLATAGFEVVTSFNSLDHVDHLAPVVAEIGRVLAPQGTFLLLTDIHRQPTVLEPSAYGWEVVTMFQPALELVEQRHFEYTVFSPEGYGDIYQSLQRGLAYDHADPRDRYGILAARFRKAG